MQWKYQTLQIYTPTRERLLREDAERLLGDIAFVLQLTRRVKEEILEEKEMEEGVLV